MKSTILWILAVAACLGAWASTFQVGEAEVAIVSRFGDPRRVVDAPGLHFKWPAPVDTVALVDRRVHVLDPEQSEFLTGDSINIVVDTFLAWRVEDPRRFLVSLQDRAGAEARLADVLHSVVGEVLNRGPFDDLVSVVERERSLEQIVGQLTSELSARCEENGFGVAVEMVGIKRINFPPQNKDAVFRRMRSERETKASEYRARGTEDYRKTRSSADAQQAADLAAADEEAKRIRGEAQAEAARILGTALEGNAELYFFLRRLDLLEAATDEDATLILPSNHALLEALTPPKSPPAPNRGDGE